MAGLLKAQFACYVRFNFDPAFHKKSGFPIRLSKNNPAFHIFPGLDEGISNGT
jgi:hypothetical protein